jgi:hypothetical protein
MAVIIRLQNLPLEARSVDIRKFFDKLLIPDGGVHIIGGEKGDAFIAFQSDEDARIAMSRNGFYLCNAQVKLFLSSKQEMQTVIAAARNQHIQAVKPIIPVSQPPPQHKPIQSELIKNSNSNELLSSLSKFISSNKTNPQNNSNNGASYQNNTNNNSNVYSSSSNNTEKSVYDQINFSGAKQPLISIPPPTNAPPTIAKHFETENLSKPPPAKLTINTDALAPLLNDILLKTNKSNNQISPNNSNNNNSSNNQSISIDQILSLLQAHKNTGNTAEANHVANPQKDHSKEHESQSFHTMNRDTNKGSQSWNSRENSNSLKSSSYSDDYQKSYNHEKDNKYDSYQSSNSNYQNKSSYTSFNPAFKRKNEDVQNNYNNRSSSTTPNSNSESDRQSKYQRTVPPFSSSTSNAPVTLDPIIKVKNFNTNCSYKDIRTFLQGIQIDHDGIKLLSDSNGNRNGMAFVKLMTITDLKKALCRNGQFYEEKTISVTQSNEADFSQGLMPSQSSGFSNSNKQSNSNQAHQNNYNNGRFNNDGNGFKSNYGDQNNKPNESEGNGFFLKIYGLPAGFDETELKSMFNNVNFVSIFTSQPTPITSTTLNNGNQEQTTVLKAKKICVVETQLDLEKALTRQNERVGKSKLQIFQMNKIEFDREMSYLNKNQTNSNNNSNNNSSNGNKNFKSYNSVENDSSENGSHQYPISDDLYIYMSGVPFSAKSLDVRTFFQPINIVDANIIHDLQTLKPTGECCCQLNNKQERDKALEKSDQLFRNRVVKIKPLTYVEYQQYISLQDKIKEQLSKRKNAILPTPLLPLPNVGAPSLMGNNVSNFNNKYQTTEKRNNYSNNGQHKSFSNQTQSKPSLIDLPPLPPELQKYRSSLVLLSNVSFDASREDILDLLKDFSPIEQTLKIRHDEMGQPTGDAIVACTTSEDALRACTELNSGWFMGLEIKTALVSS